MQKRKEKNMENITITTTTAGVTTATTATTTTTTVGEEEEDAITKIGETMRSSEITSIVVGETKTETQTETETQTQTETKTETQTETETQTQTETETEIKTTNNTNVMMNNQSSNFLPSSLVTANVTEPSLSSSLNDIVCYCCNEVGHYSFNCPQNTKGNMRNRNTTMMSTQNRTKLGQRSDVNAEMRYSNNDSARKLRNKRRPCRYNLAGRCRQGEECAFSHDIESFRNINKSMNYTNMHHIVPTQMRMYGHHPMMFSSHHTMPYSNDYMYQGTPIRNNENLAGEEEAIVDETKGQENHQNGGQKISNTRYDPTWMNAQPIHQSYYSNSMNNPHIGAPLAQYSHYGMHPYLMHNGPSIMPPYPVQYMPAYPMYSPSPIAPAQPVAQSPTDLTSLEKQSSPVNSIHTTSSALAENSQNDKLLFEEDEGLKNSNSNIEIEATQEGPVLHSPRSSIPKSDDAMMNSMTNTLPKKESEEIMDDMLAGCEEGFKVVDLEEEVTSSRQQGTTLRKTSSPISKNHNKIQKTVDDNVNSENGNIKFSKGLRNETGQNNCFLNVIIQALYHTKSFQNLFNQTKKHRCNANRSNCVYCAIKEIFNKLDKQNGEHQMISPALLRQTLSSLSSCFEAGQMSDAAEAHEIVLKALHQCSCTLYDQHSTDAYTASCNFENAKFKPLEGRSCVVHECFGMYIMEKAKCHRCQQTVNGHQYGTTVLYVPTTKLYEIEKQPTDLRFDHILGSALMGDSKKCANEKCMNDRVISSSMMIGNLPKVLTFGFTWATLQAKPEFLSSIIFNITESIILGEVFKECHQRDVHRCYKLISMVCYYGSHYSVFCIEEKTNEWFSFDDERVEYIGKYFKAMLNNCSKAHLQPLLLFYALVDEGKKTKETQQLGSFEFMIGDIRLSVPRE